MAVETTGLDLSFEVAAADLSGNQYYAASVGASGVALAGANAQIDGVIQGQPGAGDPVKLVYTGVTKAHAGAAIAKGALVATDAAGKFVTAASTNNAVGRAIEAAGADGDIFTLLLKTYGEAP